MALPKTRYNFKGGKKEVAEAVGEIGKAIFAQTRVSFESAAKMVVPTIPDMVTEIIDDLSAGPLDRFSQGIKKVDRLVNELGVDLEQYSKELAEFLKLRQEKEKIKEELNQVKLQRDIALRKQNKLLEPTDNDLFRYAEQMKYTALQNVYTYVKTEYSKIDIII